MTMPEKGRANRFRFRIVCQALKSLAPKERARAIRSALGDPTLSDFSLANEYARQATEAERELSLLLARKEAAEQALAYERAKVAELQENAAVLCALLGFPVPTNKTAFEWLDERVRSLKRNADWETQEHARHHQVEEELRATLAKVEAERDGMRAFFQEHGEQTLSNVTCAAEANEPEAAGCLACKCERDLRAILATLPKGTKGT